MPHQEFRCNLNRIARYRIFSADHVGPGFLKKSFYHSGRNYLPEIGAIELAGMDENGEPIYRFTEKLQEVAPDLYKMHMSMLNSEIMALWEKGFVDMDLFEENPTVKLTTKAFDQVFIDELNDHLQKFLKEIKRVYRERP